MRKNIFHIGLGFIFFLMGGNLLFSQNWEEVVEQANAAYQAENFEQAVSLYDSVLNGGQESANLYYNLANSWFKLGKIGPSILNYERALELKPGFEDAQVNLELVKTRAVDRIVAVPEFLVFRLWKGFRDSLNSSQWGLAAILCFWLALAGGALFLFGQKAVLKRSAFISAIAFLLLACMGCFMAASRYALELNNPYAIVMKNAVYVKSAPSENSNDLFILHEGTKVAWEDQLGEWVEIRLADGKKGWIKPEVLERI